MTVAFSFHVLVMTHFSLSSIETMTMMMMIIIYRVIMFMQMMAMMMMMVGYKLKIFSIACVCFFSKNIIIFQYFFLRNFCHAQLATQAIQGFLAQKFYSILRGKSLTSY